MGNRTYLWSDGINWSKDSNDFAADKLFAQKYPARTVTISSMNYYNASAGQYFTLENLGSLLTSVNGVTIVINGIVNYGSYGPMQIQLKMGAPYTSSNWSWYTSGYRTLTEVLGGDYTPPSSPTVASYYDESYIRGPVMTNIVSSTTSKVIIRIHDGFPGDYVQPIVETTHFISSTSAYPIVQRTYGTLPGTNTGFQGIRFRVNPDNNWYAKVNVYATTY